MSQVYQLNPEDSMSLKAESLNVVIKKLKILYLASCSMLRQCIILNCHFLISFYCQYYIFGSLLVTGIASPISYLIFCLIFHKSHNEENRLSHLRVTN